MYLYGYYSPLPLRLFRQLTRAAAAADPLGIVSSRSSIKTSSLFSSSSPSSLLPTQPMQRRRRAAAGVGPDDALPETTTTAIITPRPPSSSSFTSSHAADVKLNVSVNVKSQNSIPLQRLSLISRHLHTRPILPLNTPFSTERNSAALQEDDIPYIPLTRTSPSSSSSSPSSSRSVTTVATNTTTTSDTSGTMSSQPEHPTLLIPGPIEFDDAVLQSMSHYSESHVGPAFVATFGETLTMLRRLFQTTNPASQPFVISGSGTLGWDLVAANLAERGDEVLVLHTGYFADSFADCFETYGVKATQLKAPIGSVPSLQEVEKALKEKKYKLITVTHVDTSTGVLSDLRAVSELVHRVSPDTLVVGDGVCSVGCEEIAFDEWGLDVVLTASQKAIGCPAGLCIVMCSGRAIETFEARKTPPSSYFASFKNWLPIMKAYESKKPAYFATPSPQLIHALHTSLSQILSRPLSHRFARHAAVSQSIKTYITKRLGLSLLPASPETSANGMTAIWLPDGLKPTDVLPGLAKRGVVFAGGLHKEIATKYVRFGHMGVSVMDENRGDVRKALGAFEEVLLKECGFKLPESADGVESHANGSSNGHAVAEKTTSENGSKVHAVGSGAGVLGGT